MNCIILLLLLSCCGTGCGTGCGCGRSGCCGDGRSREDGRQDRRNDRRRENGRREDCREKEECGCRETRREGGGPRQEVERCDVPGMIPPPWQDYPGFPHRDDECGCESGG